MNTYFIERIAIIATYTKIMQIYNNWHVCQIIMHPKKKKISTFLLLHLKVRIAY